MTEGQPRPELERELLGSVYKKFIEIAEKHGQVPAEAMGMPSDGKIIKVDIPSESKTHKHTDFVSGRYFGKNTGQVGIMFRHLDRQIRLELALSNNEAEIDVKMTYFNIYKATGLDDKNPENFMLNLVSDGVSIDDLNNLKNLLTKSEEVLKTESSNLSFSQVEPSLQNELILRERELLAQTLDVHLAQKRKVRFSRGNCFVGSI